MTNELIINMKCGEIVKYIVILLVLSTIVIGDIQENCNCIRLKECMSFIILIKTLGEPTRSSFIDYVRNRQCDDHQGHSKVCCPDEIKEEREITTTTVTSPPSTTKIPKKQLCPDMSECIVLVNCTPYMNFVKSTGSPLRRSVVRFLRSQECGFQDGVPKVCCAALPTNLHALKHARPGSRRPFEKLSVAEGEESTTAATRKVTRNIVRHFDRDFSGFRDDNLASDFFDYAGNFDLIIRRKRFDNDSSLDIEIR